MEDRRCSARPKLRRRQESLSQPPAFQALEARLLLSAQWTVMVYLDGDNNLEAAAIDDFLEMASVGSDANVKVVAELDRSPESDPDNGYSADYGDWADTRRGLVQRNNQPTASWGQSIGEADMSSPNTVTSFVNWAESTYPAQKYALVLWDHGDGYDGLCWDDTTGDTAHLTPAGLGTSMAAFAAPVQLIGFDACLMSMMEVAYQVSDKAQVYVASQETESTAGWSYNEVLGDLSANPSWTPLELGKDIVARFKQDYDVPGALDTLAAIDLTKIGGPDGAAAALTAFSNEVVFHATATDATRMGNLWWDTSFFGADERTLSDYTDLGSFLEAVTADMGISLSIRTAAQTALTAYTASIASNFSGEWADSTGLSIYLPRQSAAMPSDYTASDPRFAAETGWDEFLGWWNNGTRLIPKISLTGNGRAILTGSTLPSLPRGTDFGAAAMDMDVTPPELTHVFTITNTGNSALHLTGTPKIQITGPAAGDFTVTAAPPDKIGSTQSGTFSITFHPTALGARNATVLIYSDDLSKGAFTFAIGGQGTAPSGDKDPIVVVEGDSGTVNAVFPVTISGDPTEPTYVTYTTVPGTAGDGTDYQGVSGTLTFLPGGALRQTVTVPVLGDTDPELDETFYLDLSGATQALINPAQTRRTGIIKDNDSTVKPFGGGVKATFFDRQGGGAVTVSLTGPGDGTVLLDSLGNCLGIGVNGSQDTSALTVTVGKALRGNGGATVKDIVIDGSMKSIAAGAVNLTGNLHVTGLLGTLVLNNVIGPGTLDIDTALLAPASSPALTMTLGRVADAAVNTHALPIGSLTATEWLNTPGSPAEQIAAPSLARLTIKGDAQAGPAGNFQAGLVLDGSDKAGQTLGTVKIAGAVAGAEWDVTGTVGSIAITGVTSDWTLRGPGNTLSGLTTLTLGRVRGANVSVDVNGTLGTLKAIEWVGGTLAARSITSLSTVGIPRTNVAGDFGPAVRITGLIGTGLALGTAKIAGAVADSAWLIDGNVGTIGVTGNTTNWTLQGTGAAGEGLQAVKSLTVGDATNCQLQSQDVLGTLKAIRWTGGSIQANRLDTLNVVGNKALSIPGDFSPTELNVLGADMPLHKTALGSATIAGDVRNSLWCIHGSAGAVTVNGWVNASDVCLTGGMTSLTVGAAQASDFFAGIDLAGLDLATTRRATASASFGDPAAKIGSLTVRGLTVPKNGRFVADSNFSAPFFGAVKLTNPDSGPVYGLYADDDLSHVTKVSITDTLTRQNWSWAPTGGKAFPVVGSLVLQTV